MFGVGMLESGKKCDIYDGCCGYPKYMSEIEIVQSSFHSNGRAAPFYAAIIDDPDGGDTKLVIMFDEQDYTAVLSLDTLVQDEDISAEAHGFHGNRYDDSLRDALWYPNAGDGD